MSFLLTQESPSLLLVLVSLIGGYLSGSVPYGLILSKLAGLGDIRKAGSGNIGATNVLRVGGKKLGAATLILDALKGVVPVLVAKSFHMDYAVLAALGAFIGHIFPIWLKFKGGKGVATALGVLTALYWPLGLAMVCTWLITALTSKYSSLSALVAFGAAPLLAAILTHGQFQMIAVTLIISVIVWLRHRDNLKRLMAGSEGTINLGKKA